TPAGQRRAGGDGPGAGRRATLADDSPTAVGEPHRMTQVGSPGGPLPRAQSQRAAAGGIHLDHGRRGARVDRLLARLYGTAYLVAHLDAGAAERAEPELD